MYQTNYPAKWEKPYSTPVEKGPKTRTISVQNSGEAGPWNLLSSCYSTALVEMRGVFVFFFYSVRFADDDTGGDELTDRRKER